MEERPGSAARKAAAKLLILDAQARPVAVGPQHIRPIEAQPAFVAHTLQRAGFRPRRHRPAQVIPAARAVRGSWCAVIWRHEIMVRIGSPRRKTGRANTFHAPHLLHGRKLASGVTTPTSTDKTAQGEQGKRTRCRNDFPVNLERPVPAVTMAPPVAASIGTDPDGVSATTVRTTVGGQPVVGASTTATRITTTQ